MLDKRDTVSVFRERLASLIERSNLSQSRFATEAGLDRSTLSQLLSETNVRLPRVETLARIATQNNVSVDWLIGLTQTDQLGTEILRQLEIAPGERSDADELLARWHREAVGYKIRYVPMSLPDLLKTPTVIEYEFRSSRTTSPEVRKEEAEERLAYSRRPETDMETCTSFQLLEQFAGGTGTWSGLPAQVRRDQMDRMADLVDELYPTFRWFLFDGREHYAAAYTIFGPLKAAVYMGRMFFVFNSTEHIRVLTRHFDNLIREAVIQPNECGSHIRRIAQDIEQ